MCIVKIQTFAYERQKHAGFAPAAEYKPEHTLCDLQLHDPELV